MLCFYVGLFILPLTRICNYDIICRNAGCKSSEPPRRERTHYGIAKELQENAYRLLSRLYNTGNKCKFYSIIIFDIQEYLRNHP